MEIKLIKTKTKTKKMTTILKFNITSPLDQFEVTNLISVNAPLLGYLNLSLTNLSLYSFVVLTVIISLHYLSNNNHKVLPSK
jgi:F-type H+-transporting ATPase subunit a